MFLIHPFTLSLCYVELCVDLIEEYLSSWFDDAFRDVLKPPLQTGFVILYNSPQVLICLEMTKQVIKKSS